MLSVPSPVSILVGFKVVCLRSRSNVDVPKSAVTAHASLILKLALDSRLVSTASFFIQDAPKFVLGSSSGGSRIVG
jgi:hypothetical protein